MGPVIHSFGTFNVDYQLLQGNEISEKRQNTAGYIFGGKQSCRM